MRRKERVPPRYDKIIVKLNKLITKFEHVLEKESAAETRSISNPQLFERENYYIIESLKILKEDLAKE